MVNPKIQRGMEKTKTKKKKNGEPQRYRWDHRRDMVKPRDIAGNTEEEYEW